MKKLMKVANRWKYKEAAGETCIKLNIALLSIATLLIPGYVADAWSWSYEINPHFSPNVPSSTSGPVDYEYKFEGSSYGYVDCVPESGVDGETYEYGTISGTQVTWHAVAERGHVSPFYICWQSPDPCSGLQSVDWMTNPTTYSPNSGSGCGIDYADGGFYSEIDGSLNSSLPCGDWTTETNSGSGWSVVYTYGTPTPWCYYFKSGSCDCGNGVNAYSDAWGWSAYYDIVVHLDTGVSLPPGAIPALPGPVGVNICTNPKALVSAVNSFGTLRNNLNGWVGFHFHVGGSPLVVTALGRWIVSGNTSSHAVELVYSDGTPLPGGSVIVNTSGQLAGTFAYTPLNDKITLNAGTTYAIMSQEVDGGDQWYDYTSTTVTLSPEASAPFAVSAPPYTEATGGSGRSYGPVNLLFCQ